MREITEKIKALLADPDAFRGWLEAQPEGARFLTESPYSCPLACYLAEQTGPEVVVVNVGSTIVSMGGEYIADMPAWAGVFTLEVDAYAEADAGGYGFRISRDQALGCLRETACTDG